MHHYRCGQYLIDRTRATRIANSVKIYQSHCKMLTISEEDRTIFAAAELVQQLTKNKALGCEEKIKHAKVLDQINAIIANKLITKVAPPAPQKVPAPSTMKDTTAPRMVRQIKQIHRWTTRSNTPMPIITE